MKTAYILSFGLLMAAMMQRGPALANPTKNRPRSDVHLNITLTSAHVSLRHHGRLRVTLTNASGHSVTAWGFHETATGGPDMDPYVEIHMARLRNGKREMEFQTHRSLPPIDDLYGKAYDLKPGQSWTQDIESWLLSDPQGKPLPSGDYDVWVEWDDSTAVKYLSINKSKAIGKISSSPFTVFVGE